MSKYCIWLFHFKDLLHCDPSSGIHPKRNQLTQVIYQDGRCSYSSLPQPCAIKCVCFMCFFFYFSLLFLCYFYCYFIFCNHAPFCNDQGRYPISCTCGRTIKGLSIYNRSALNGGNCPLKPLTSILMNYFHFGQFYPPHFMSNANTQC